MKELTAFLMIIIGIFIYIHFLRNNLFLDKVVSSVNNKEYFVRNLPDKKQAADKLANLGNSLQNLINSLNNNDKIDDINRLKENFESEHITENIPGSLYVAYSLNKGAELSICIRNKENNNFIDLSHTLVCIPLATLSYYYDHEIISYIFYSFSRSFFIWDSVKTVLSNHKSYFYIIHHLGTLLLLDKIYYDNHKIFQELFIIGELSNMHCNHQNY